MKHTRSTFTTPPHPCLPVGRGAHDDTVNQDAMCHILEGRVFKLQLSNDADVNGPKQKHIWCQTQLLKLCCHSDVLSVSAGISDSEAFTSASVSALLHQCIAALSPTR